MTDAADADSLAPYDEPPSPGDTLRFSTTLEPGRFLGLSLKNGLLNIITLTLYRFWGKTEVRDRVWRGVRLNDEAFEYTGRGVELFIGFILATVVLGVPFLALVFAVQFMGEWVFAVVALPLYIFIFWLWGFGTYTAFRYMASRTTWRGVRFRLKGSAANYGLHYIFSLFLSSITLGWFWPHAQRGLAGKIWGEVRFGDRRLHFRSQRAEREGIYGPFALGWFGSLLGYVVLMLGVMGTVLATGAAESLGSGQPAAPSIMFTLGLYGVMLLAAPFVLLIWAPYQAALLRSIVAGLTFDDAGFKLNVKAIPLWWLTVTNLFFLLITLGFLMPWVQARTAKFLVSRLESAGHARLDLAQQTERGPSTGEGLADAFGFSAI